MTAPGEGEKALSNGNTEVIGKARLLRKNTLIDEARLIIKKHEKNLIYWEFDKWESKVDWNKQTEYDNLKSTPWMQDNL